MKKTFIGIVVLTAVGAFVGGCGHDVQSPVPKGQKAAPDLVCNAQPVSAPFSTVVLHGDNFTPMPSKTLEKSPALILPKIALERTQTLPGGPTEASGGPDTATIADDPAKPLASRVHWTSEKEMSFDVKPEDELPTGVFSITVTNPDGKGKTTISKGLAVLPPPIVSAVKPPAICDDQSEQTLIVTGAYFLAFDDKAPAVTVAVTDSSALEPHTYPAVVDPMSCAPLDGSFTEQNVQVCTSLTIKIPAGDFPVTESTKASVVVTNPAPADCASSDEVDITLQPPPKVDTVLPATVCEGGGQITVGGEGFISGAKVALDCMGTQVEASSANVSDDGTKIGATFGPGASAGSTCDVIVKNPDGCEDRPLPHKTVTATTGPILFFADPPVVYNGINTRITLYATTITPPLPTDAVSIVPSGASAPVTGLSFTPVPNHPNRLQAVVPAAQEPGIYDITLKDSTDCFATLPKALVITKDLTVTLKSVDPPFGAAAEDTAISISRDAAAPAPADQAFVATPRVFLNPTNPQPTDVAVEVEAVSFVDGNTATGVVPAGTPAHGYDVVLVNPDGSVGLLPAGYREAQAAPPVITGATPASIAASTGEVVVLTGSNFAVGDTVSLRCVDAAGAPVPSPSLVSSGPSCVASACTEKLTIDGSTLAAGDVCIVRLTNPDESYGEFSAIGVTTPSLNLNSPQPGTDMTVGRRALSAASGNATPAARFVYALGGDSGQASGALDSTEFAPVDLFGKMGAWTLQKQPLNAPRTLAGAATVGRYIYLVGGDDGAGPTDSAERALILSPRETPVIEDVDLALGAAGLDEGDWHYRVSAIFDANDTDNPGGESLPSDAFSIKLPTFPGKKIAVTLVWKAPVDALSTPIPGVAGYRIYRTVKANDAPGTEVLLATVGDPAKLTFTDDGTQAPGTEVPLPTGSTGHWLPLPKLGTKRSGLAVVAGDDPVTPNKFYLYALLGKSAPTTANATYEYLPVTIGPNGRQTVATTWTPGAQAASSARWQAGAWLANNAVSSLIKGSDTFIFLGGGLNGDDTKNGVVEAGKIAPGGDLGVISNVPKDFSASAAGYGVCAANGQLFLFGGSNGAPSPGARSAFFDPAPGNPPPGLTSNSWNNEGLNMTHGRYLLGSAVQSSFIFLLGGQTDEPAPAGTASKTTELVIW